MKKLIILTAVVFVALLGVGSAITTTAPQQRGPYPTDCVEGPINTVAPNYEQQPVPPGYCEICLMVSVKDPWWPGGEQLIGEICNLSSSNMTHVYSLMSRIMYCGAVLPAHGWEDYGRGWSPPLIVNAERYPENCEGR